MTHPASDEELDPAAARMVARPDCASARTSPEGSAGAAADVTALLPRGARIVSTTVGEERIAVTIDVAGAMEIRTFDARTLRPVGRLRFATEP